jgi:hypothetical protein
MVVKNKCLSRLLKELISMLIRPLTILGGIAKSHSRFVAKGWSGSVHGRVGEKDG